MIVLLMRMGVELWVSVSVSRLIKVDCGTKANARSNKAVY